MTMTSPDVWEVYYLFDVLSSQVAQAAVLGSDDWLSELLLSFPF